MESVLKFWGALWLVVGILSFLNVLGTHSGGFGAFLTALIILLCTVVPFVLFNCCAKLWENISEINRRKKLAAEKK